MTAIDTASARRYIEELELPKPDTELRALCPFVQRATSAKAIADEFAGGAKHLPDGAFSVAYPDVANKAREVNRTCSI